MQRVLLWDTVVRDRGGLDAEFSGFSEGQKQLFSLARCLLDVSSHAAGKKLVEAPVALLDEVTSSIDSETEAAVRSILWEEFKKRKCTVVEVLHRLEFVEEFDQVVVLRKGIIAEFGSPDALLGKKDSLLREMWIAKKTG